MMAHRRFRIKLPGLIPTLLGGFLLLALLSGCGSDGGGGGGGSAAPSPASDPAEGSIWDKMGWDKGKWG